MNWKLFFPDWISRDERRKRIRLRGHRRHHLRRDCRWVHLWASGFYSNDNDHDYNNRINSNNNNRDNNYYYHNRNFNDNRSAVVLLHLSDWIMWLEYWSGYNPIKLKSVQRKCKFFRKNLIRTSIARVSQSRFCEIVAELKRLAGLFGHYNISGFLTIRPFTRDIFSHNIAIKIYFDFSQ